MAQCNKCGTDGGLYFDLSKFAGVPRERIPQRYAVMESLFLVFVSARDCLLALDIRR